jgi:hypothetical protein
MASDIRERARQILLEVPPFGQQINSVGPTAAKFLKMTGTSQAVLEANWKTGGIMTTCNAFVGWYGTQLGSKNYLGRFDIETMVKKWGKEHAWIPVSSGAQPKYGDIFRPKKFHIGLSLDFEGGMWNTAESGQGGSKTGYDIIKRKRSNWDPGLIQGWVDIELLLGDGDTGPAPTVQKSSAPVPDWLPGWWVVSWRHETYYYFFDRNFGVSWTLVKPSSPSQPPAGDRDKGKVSIEPMNVITIVWSATGSVEKLVKAPTVNEQMNGTWNGKEALSAVRL